MLDRQFGQYLDVEIVDLTGFSGTVEVRARQTGARGTTVFAKGLGTGKVKVAEDRNGLLTITVGQATPSYPGVNAPVSMGSQYRRPGKGVTIIVVTPGPVRVRDI